MIRSISSARALWFKNSCSTISRIYRHTRNQAARLYRTTKKEHSRRKDAYITIGTKLVYSKIPATKC